MATSTRPTRSLSDVAKHGRPSNLINHQYIPPLINHQYIPPVPSVPPYMRKNFSNSSSPARIDSAAPTPPHGPGFHMVGPSPPLQETQSQTNLSSTMKVLNPKTHHRRSSNSSEVLPPTYHHHGIAQRTRRSSSFISTTGSFPPPGLLANSSTLSPASSNKSHGGHQSQPEDFSFAPTQSLAKDKNSAKKNFKNKVKGWEVEKSFQKIKFDGWEAGLADLLEMENTRPSTKMRNVNKNPSGASTSRLVPNNTKLSTSKSQNNLSEGAAASSSMGKISGSSGFGFKAKLGGGLLLSKLKK